MVILKTVTRQVFHLSFIAILYFSSAAVHADQQPVTYSKPPMGTFSSQMDDALLGNKYEKPVWNLHDALSLPDWLTVNVDQRTRYEELNTTFKANTNGSDQQIALQTDLWLQAKLGAFRFAVEVMDSRALDADVGIGKNVGSGVNGNMAETADFLQAYVSWAEKKILSTNVGAEIKVGRQMMELGSTRLVGEPYFRNTFYNYTGGRFRFLNNGKWQFNGFVTMPVTHLPTTANAIIGDNQVFDQEATHTVFSGGILEGYNLFMRVNMEGYLYHLDEADSYNNPTRKRRYFTPGMRFYIKPSKGQFDFQAEGMGQIGTVRYNTTANQDQQHQAWSEHVDLGYSFNLPWSPRFLLEYDYASGSRHPGSTNNATDQRFDSLYANSVIDFGPTGIYGPFQRSNINSPGYKLNFEPRSNIKLSFQQRLIWLASANDCWGGAACTNAAQAVLFPTHSSGSYVGNQFGMSARYDFNSSLNFETGWFRLVKGQFAQQGVSSSGGATTVPGQDVDFLYVQSQLRF